MTAPDPTAEIERISERIKALVADHFGRGEERFFLSGLGSALGDDRGALEKLTKRKLADFVEHVLGFEIGRTGQFLNVLHITRPANLGPPTAPARSKPIKFIHEIWAAFTTPLPEGEHRYIDLATRALSSSPPMQGGDVREIPAPLISDGTSSAAQTAENIRQWVESEGLNLGLFVASRGRRHEDGSSLLHQLLEALDGDQLRRMVLPLDVVKTLSDRRSD